MARKIMLEATQPVVDGNTVVVESGALFEPDGDLPDGVRVREVIAEVPDGRPVKPAAKPAAG